MLTDGIFNGDIPLEKQERSLYSTLEKYGGFECDKIADRIMHEMERKFGVIGDDRTVLVMKIDHVLPKWSSFTPYSQTISRERVIG